jgi:hypothetical protein
LTPLFYDALKNVNLPDYIATNPKGRHLHVQHSGNLKPRIKMYFASLFVFHFAPTFARIKYPNLILDYSVVLFGMDLSYKRFVINPQVQVASEAN